MGLPQYEDQYVQVDGRSIHYWVAGGGPKKILLVHGAACSVQYWHYNLGPLAGAGRQVYAMDLPGCGRSDKQVPEFSLAYGTSFLGGFMDALGINRATLVGHSMGGTLCAQFAVTSPHRTQALILVDSAGFGRELHLFLRLWTVPVLGDLLFWVYQMAFPALKSWVFLNGSSVSDEWVQGAAAMLRMPGVREAGLKMARTGANLWGQRQELFDDLHTGLSNLSNLPALIVWGDGDQAVDVAHAHVAQGLISGSELRIMQGRGHVPQVERPAEFNALLLDFLATVPPGP